MTELRLPGRPAVSFDLESEWDSGRSRYGNRSAHPWR